MAVVGGDNLFEKPIGALEVLAMIRIQKEEDVIKRMSKHLRRENQQLKLIKLN